MAFGEVFLVGYSGQSRAGKMAPSCPLGQLITAGDLVHLVRSRSQPYNNITNHKNYNFLACDWFKNVLFSTYSLAKLLSDSLLLDSLISQSHLKMQFKSTNHIQNCNYVCMRALLLCVFPLDLGDVYAPFVSILMRIFPFFHNFAIFLFRGNCNFYD